MWWWRTALGGATTKYTIVEGAPSTVAVDGSINRVPPPFKGCIDNAPPLLIGAFTAIILIVLTTGIWFTGKCVSVSVSVSGVIRIED
jgi:hypothetical protein